MESTGISVDSRRQLSRAPHFQEPANNDNGHPKLAGIRRFLTWGKPNKARTANSEITMEPHPDALEGFQRARSVSSDIQGCNDRIEAPQQPVQPVNFKTVNIENIQREIRTAFQLAAKNKNLDAFIHNRTLAKEYHNLKAFYGMTYAFTSKSERVPTSTHQHDPMGLVDGTPIRSSLPSHTEKMISDSIKNSRQHDRGKTKVPEPTQIEENRRGLEKAIEQHRAIKLKQLIERSSDYFPILPNKLTYSFLLQMRRLYSTLSARLDYSQRSFLLGIKADVINQLARKIPEQYNDQLGLDTSNIRSLLELRAVLEEILAAKNSFVYEPEATEQQIADSLTAVKKMITYRSIRTNGATTLDIFSRAQWQPIVRELFENPVTFTPECLVDRLLVRKLQDIAISSSTSTNKEVLYDILKQSHNSSLISFYETCRWLTRQTEAPQNAAKKSKLEVEEHFQARLWEIGASRQNQALVDSASCVKEITAFFEDEAVQHLQIPIEETRILFSKIDMIGFCHESPIELSEQLEIDRIHFNEALKSLCQYFSDENNVKRLRDNIKACNYSERINLNRVFNQIDFMRLNAFSS